MGTADEIIYPIVLFDGVCNLCNGAVHLIIDHEKESLLHFAPLQSELGKKLLQQNGLDVERLDSIVFIEDSHSVYIKSRAALKLAGYLKKPYAFARVLKLVPRGLTDLIYDFVAKYRYRWFGRGEQCRIPTPELKDRFIDSAILS